MSPLRFRLLCVLLFIVGAAFIASNVHDIQAHGTFRSRYFILGSALLVTMPVFVVVGKPIDAKTGEPPVWWRVMSGALGAIGAGIGFWLSIHLE